MGKKEQLNWGRKMHWERKRREMSSTTGKEDVVLEYPPKELDAGALFVLKSRG
jgi:hypothetical protein